MGGGEILLRFVYVRDTCTRIKTLFFFLFLQNNKRWRGV